MYQNFITQTQLNDKNSLLSLKLINIEQTAINGAHKCDGYFKEMEFILLRGAVESRQN